MRVLVIEDEHKIANSIKKGLEHEKYVVDTAYNGSDGLDLSIGEEYDLIILDRLLPGVDGIEICKKLRSEGNHTPILMLTAKGQTKDKIEGLDSGADDYLVKPFAFTELFARVRALVRRPKKMSKAVLEIDTLSLDAKAYEVKRNNKVIQLSTKEFMLLEYLMRHQNAIITKEQIIAHVWNYDADVLPNTVEVYIKHLRDKVDVVANGHRLIHTVRGFGYKLRVEK